MSEEVTVASSGTVDLHQRCRECGSDMLYRVGEFNRPVAFCAAFCGQIGCADFGVDRPVSGEVIQ